VIARDSTAALVGQLDAKTLVIRPQGMAPANFALPPEVSREDRRDGRLALSYRTGITSANDVLDAVRAAGIIIADVASVEPDLEDVFVALTSSKSA
jgi:ABC-2 type transport system ATP-binding protein